MLLAAGYAVSREEKMIFGFFKRKDPACGMKEEKGKGISDTETGRWFCSSSCRDNYHKALKHEQKKGGRCCCS